MASDGMIALYCIISVVVTLLVVFLLKKLFAHLLKPKLPRLASDYPKNTALFHTFGKSKYCPSLSPFVNKLETYFRITKIPYEHKADGQLSSKGKAPWMEYNGKEYEDSQFIIDFLNEERGIDLNKTLDNEQKAVSRAMLKMIEDDLYWILVTWRWVDKDASELTDMSGGAIPKLALSLILKDKVKGYCFAQGMGRHTLEQRINMARADFRALSDYKGDKKYMCGDEPTEVDASAFGMLSCYVWGTPNSPYEKMITTEFPNLVEYCNRVKSEYWPDWEDCILH